MSRFWVYALGTFVVAGGFVLGLSLIPGYSNLEPVESPELASAEALEPVTEDPVKIKAGRWTGSSEKHPAARLRENRIEKGRMGIPPRKRRSEGSLNRPLWEQEFGGDALARAGYSAEEIERLKRKYEDARDTVLGQLALGPYGDSSSPSRAEEERAQEALASLVGEADDYDALLYATQQPNRLEVLHTTPLGRAHGLKPGDVFWSYLGDRIFPNDGYRKRIRTDQIQGRFEPVVFYRPGEGFFSVLMKKDKQSWGVFTRPVSAPPGQETAQSG